MNSSRPHPSDDFDGPIARAMRGSYGSIAEALATPIGERLPRSEFGSSMLEPGRRTATNSVIQSRSTTGMGFLEGIEIVEVDAAHTPVRTDAEVRSRFGLPPAYAEITAEALAELERMTPQEIHDLLHHQAERYRLYGTERIIVSPLAHPAALSEEYEFVPYEEDRYTHIMLYGEPPSISWLQAHDPILIVDDLSKAPAYLVTAEHIREHRKDWPPGLFSQLSPVVTGADYATGRDSSRVVVIDSMTDMVAAFGPSAPHLRTIDFREAEIRALHIDMEMPVSEFEERSARWREPVNACYERVDLEPKETPWKWPRHRHWTKQAKQHQARQKAKSKRRR